MNIPRSIKKGQTIKTHEIIIVDPVTKKCRRMTPANGGLFVFRFEAYHKDGESRVVDELQVNMGDELAGCPVT